MAARRGMERRHRGPDRLLLRPALDGEARSKITKRPRHAPPPTSPVPDLRMPYRMLAPEGILC